MAFQEIGGTVIGSLSGSLDLSGMTVVKNCILRSVDTLTVTVGSTLPEPGKVALVVTTLTLRGVTTRRRR